MAGVPGAFSWAAAIALAARRTRLRPGELIVGPPVAVLEGVSTGVQVDVEGIGTLDCPIA